MIILKRRSLEPREPLSTQVRQQGYWKMRAVNAKTGKVRELTDWFPNLILNAGLDAIGTVNTVYTTVAVGTGSTPPAVTDTSLVAPVAVTSDSVGSTIVVGGGPPDYWASMARTFRFAEGEAAGNLSEVGIGHFGSYDPASYTHYWARSLILDGLGNPTTITVLPDEFLDVTYELRNYPPLTDVVGEITISGVTYRTVTRALYVDSASWWAPPAGGRVAGMSSSGFGVYNGTLDLNTENSPTGSSGGGPDPGTVVNDPYTPGSYERSWSLEYGLERGNVEGGISAVRIYLGTSWTDTTVYGAVQVGFFDPLNPSTPLAIPKNETNILVFEGAMTWGRYTP
jgi:hypothetical protein